MSASRRPLPVWADIVLLPLINIVLAFVVVGIIVEIIGVNPFDALKLLVAGAIGSRDSIAYTLYYATNFIFTGLAVSVAFHAGLFNIGGEGQAYIGGLGCGLAILAFDRFLPAWLLIPVAIIAAALFGAAWAAVGPSNRAAPSTSRRSSLRMMSPLAKDKHRRPCRSTASPISGAGKTVYISRYGNPPHVRVACLEHRPASWRFR